MQGRIQSPAKCRNRALLPREGAQGTLWGQAGLGYPDVAGQGVQSTVPSS